MGDAAEWKSGRSGPLHICHKSHRDREKLPLSLACDEEDDDDAAAAHLDAAVGGGGAQQLVVVVVVVVCPFLCCPFPKLVVDARIPDDEGARRVRIFL